MQEEAARGFQCNGAEAIPSVTIFAMRLSEKERRRDGNLDGERKATSVMDIKDRTTNCKPSRKKSRKEVLRLKLQKLCRLRFGNHFLPDNDEGRAMLTALLCVGLTDESAIETAPWCEASELRMLKLQARQVKWWHDKKCLRQAHQNKSAIGKLINLTFDEWKSAKLWLTWPIDASDDDMEAWREEQRQISSRKSSAKQRAKQNMMKETMLETGRTLATTPRQKAILDIIIKRHAAERGIKSGMSVPELIKKVVKLPEFERVKNLRDAVHETLNQLERKNAIRTRFYRRHRIKCVELNTSGPFSEAKMVSERCRIPVRHAFERNTSEINGLAENGLRQHDREVKLMNSTHNKRPLPSKPEAPEITPAKPSKPQCSTAGQDSVVVVLHPKNRIGLAA